MEINDRIILLLGAQKALLGMITPRMRGVTMRMEGRKIFLRFILDSPQTMEDFDTCHEVASEVAAEFNDALVDVEIITREMPSPIVDLGMDDWAFIRSEEQ